MNSQVPAPAQQFKISRSDVSGQKILPVQLILRIRFGMNDHVQPNNVNSQATICAQFLKLVYFNLHLIS